MRLVIFDIQHPIDPQVNGFGFYRSVVDGTEELLIDKVQIPEYDTYSGTNPWEAADVTDEGLMFLGTGASLYHYHGETDPTSCTSTQIWEIENDDYRNSEDFINGFRGLHRWEIEYLIEKNPLFVQTRNTWAYATIIEDDGLGGIVEADNDIPPFASLVAAFQEHVFVAGDPDNPNYLYWSKRFRPESFSIVNYVEIGNADDPITQLAPIAGVLGVFTRATKYRVTGNASDGFVHWEAISHRGTRSPKSVKVTDKGILYVAPDGVWSSNLIGPDKKLSDKIDMLFAGVDADENSEEEPINQDALEQIAGGYHKNRYYFSYPSGTSEINDRTAVYSFDTEQWTIYDSALGSLVAEDDTNLLVVGGTDGAVYVFETTSSDNGSKIEFDAKTKGFYEGEGSGVRCLFLYFKVDAKIPAGEEITADFIVDDTVVSSTTITGDRTKILNPLPEGSWGYRWQLRLYGETDKEELEVNSVTSMYLPLGVS
jgi:hypothetical protein